MSNNSIQTTVGGLLIASDETILLVKTHKWKDRYGIPGGKIEFGESLEDALRREIREETALEISEICFLCLQESVCSHEFYRPAHLLLANFSARVASKTVKLNEEAEKFCWVLPAEALAMDLNTPTRFLVEEFLAAEDRAA